MAGWPPPAQRSSRRWLWAGIAVVVVLAALAPFVIGPQTSSTPTGSTYTDPTNHFSANFHDKPVENDQTMAVSGHSVPEVLWTDTINNSAAEIVGYASFPADFTFATPHAALDGSVAGEVANSKGTLLSKTFGTFQGFESVDAVISLTGTYVESRAILAGRTLYIVVVSSSNNPPELFASFANSMHIISHAG